MSTAGRKKQANRTPSKPKRGSARGFSPVSPRNAVSHPQFFQKQAFFGWAFWVSLALIAANFAIYYPVWNHGFLNYDDPQYVTDNPHVAAGLTWAGVWWALGTGYFANWHPLTWLSHMLDVQLYGVNAGPHHLTNLLLHTVNSILLFGLLRRMTGAPGRSAFVAALFAVHPLHVESVAWVAERKDVLSTLFGFLTLWAYAGYARQPRVERYVMVFLLFALGLMAKPMLVTLPFVMLLLDYWPLRRAATGNDLPALGMAPSPSAWSIWLRLALEKVPLLALAVASSTVTFVAQQRGGALIKLDALPWSQRVANALVSYVTYIGKTVWPARLAAFYPYARSLAVWRAAGAALILAGVSVAVLRAARSRPYLPVGWLWYLGTLVPVIGLVQVGNQSMADRYTYIPLIGLFIIVAWGAPDLLSRYPHRRIALPAAAGVAILACAITAHSQVVYWADSVSLWEHALEVTRENSLANYNLGVALSDEGRTDEAMAHYTEALRIKPDYADADTNLGLALANQGKVSEAIAHYTSALRNNPDLALAHFNLGVALEGQGKVDEAIAHYSKAVRLDTSFAVAQYNLGVALAKQGRIDEAIAHYFEAIRDKPDYPEAHNNLGVVLAARGRTTEAMAHYSEALRIKPDYPDAQNNLGNVLAKEGRVGEAIPHYSEALRVNPDHVNAHINLGLALEDQGKVDEAIREFQAALRINPGSLPARGALENLASQGRRSGPAAR